MPCTRRRRLLGLLAGICWWLLNATAQSGPYSFEHYGTEQGLSHDETTCLLKDREGFLWVGTVAGLNRFDGRFFRTFMPVKGDSTSLPSESITGLSQDPMGRIWVSTNRGLCWYDAATGAFHQLNPAALPTISFQYLQMSKLSFDRHGQAWFVAGEYLVRLDLKTLSCALFPLPGQISVAPQVLVDREGFCWVSANYNVLRFDPQRKTFQLIVGREAKDPALRVDAGSLNEDAQGRVWISSWGKGLFYFDPVSDKVIDYSDGPRISTCFLRQNNPGGPSDFWVGGGVYGLYIFHVATGEATELKQNPYEPLSHNGSMAFDILQEKQTGIIWVATEKGLEKYDPYSVRFQRIRLPVEADLNQFSFVSSFLRDRNDPSGDTYWIGAWGSGLFRWNRHTNTFKRFKHPEQLFSNEVFDVAQLRDGRLAFALFGGVQFFDPRTGGSRFLTGFMKTPLRNNKVLAIQEDTAGTLWIGTNYDGLFRYDPRREEIRKIVFADSLQHENGAHRVTQLLEDRTHRIWISTFNGIYRYDPATDRCRRMEMGFPLYYVAEDLCLDKSGAVVWAATRSGLFKIDTSGYLSAVYGNERGLTTDQVYRVRQDQQGNLWIGTNQGLYEIDPRTDSLENFDKSDGLFSNTMHDGFELLPDGELFLGFQNAFNYFDPQHMPRNLTAPKVALTGLRVMNQERRLGVGELLSLGPKENVVTFEFAALNFSQSEKNRYAYRLEGFDEGWTYTSQPSATYTNLDGGRYRFLVKAANNDGVWNEEGLSIPVRVFPPFYRSAFFPVLLSILLLGIGGAILQYRRLQKLQLEAIRNRIARDLHDDMGSTLSSIRFFSEYARAQVADAKPEVVPFLERISSSAATLSESMQDIIWTINSRHDQLDDLVTRMREFGFRTLEARHITFNAQISKGFRPMRLSIGQRRNLYLIFKETVNNAVKYSGCSKVTLFLTIVRNNLKMIIEDDGQGFDIEQARDGNGLRNMRQRAMELGGELIISAQPGQGTRIELTARLK